MKQIVKKNENEVERESGKSSGHLARRLSGADGRTNPAG